MRSSEDSPQVVQLRFYEGVRDAANRLIRCIRRDGPVTEQEFIHQLLKRARDFASPELAQLLTEAKVKLQDAVLLNLGADDV